MHRYKPLTVRGFVGGRGENRTRVYGFAVRCTEHLQRLDLSRFPLKFGCRSHLNYNNDYGLESRANTQSHQPKLEVKGLT